MQDQSEASEGLQGSVFGLRLIEFIASQAKPLGLTEILAALSLSKSRVFRHLQNLVAHGYLVQNPVTDQYSIGPRAVSLGIALERGSDLIELAFPVLRELRDRLGHTAVISQVEPAGVRVLATVTGQSLIEIGVRRGSLLVMHATAQGKVALAFGNKALQRETLRRPLQRMTPFTIVNPVKLRAELRRVEENGWATAFNEVLVGVNTLAAPVRGADGSLIATIGILDSIQHISEKPSPSQVQETVSAAGQLSERLGYYKLP